MLRPESCLPGGLEGWLWLGLGLCRAGARSDHQKEFCRVGAERGGEGRRQARTDGGSELEGSAQTSPQHGEGGRPAACGSRARALEGASAGAGPRGAVHLAARSVPGTFVHPLALYA